MKNKESRSSTNEFTSIPTKISAKEEIYTSTCVARKSAVNGYGKQDHRGRIPNRISIKQRPPIVAQKSRIGDWESDTVIVKGHQACHYSYRA